MLRMTEEEFAKLNNKKHKKNKYNAKKTKIDGITFFSAKEAKFYQKLKIRQQSGEITGFCLQPKFILIEGTDTESKTEYRADFIVFYPDGKYEIIDTKGVQTDVFKLKLKLFKSKYPQLDLILK